MMVIGSLNQNLATGHSSLTQTADNHTGVILMGTSSAPPWTLGGSNSEVVMCEVTHLNTLT